MYTFDWSYHHQHLSFSNFYINQGSPAIRPTVCNTAATKLSNHYRSSFIPKHSTLSKMEAFPYQQHHPYLLDSLYIPNSPNIEMALPPHQVGEMSNASSSCFTGCYYPSEPIPEASTTDNLSSDSTKDSKRKQGDGSCLSSGQSKGTKETKSRRKKKGNGGLKGPEQEEEKRPKADKMENSKASENPPSGYIHVRARRGQATDSHSLAERVRRERISERMKKLQGLVPGCDKVIGKALVLDEIINYVQSLQNQVEFLSMKLASVNPILYEFGVGFDDFMNQPEEMGIMSQPIPSVIQASRIPPTAFEGATSNSSVIDSLSASSLHGQGPTNVFSQNNGSFLMQVDDHRRGFTNQVQLHNPCSFQ